MALGAETSSAISYYKANKLIAIQWDVSEILIVLFCDRNLTKKFLIHDLACLQYLGNEIDCRSENPF
jgi:hypothetical protein